MRARFGNSPLALALFLATLGIAGLAGPGLAFHPYNAAFPAQPPTNPQDWAQDGAGVSNFSHWDLREFRGCRIPWSAHNGTADLPGLSEFTEVANAFATWEAVTPAQIGFTQVVAPAG